MTDKAGFVADEANPPRGGRRSTPRGRREKQLVADEEAPLGPTRETQCAWRGGALGAEERSPIGA